MDGASHILDDRTIAGTVEFLSDVRLASRLGIAGLPCARCDTAVDAKASVEGAEIVRGEFQVQKSRAEDVKWGKWAMVYRIESR